MNPALRKARATIAAIQRHNGPDDPRLPRLQTQFAIGRLEERIAADRERLARLLKQGAGHGS